MFVEIKASLQRYTRILPWRTAHTEGSSMPTRQASLLLVDDDPAAIQIMGGLLSEYPDQRFATSGPAALRLARERIPDLILMDVEMPGMTGFDVGLAMKADAALEAIPFIYVTSHHATALKQAAMRQGAVDVVTKPLHPSQFVSRVRAQLRTMALVDAAQDDTPSAGVAAQPPPRGQAARLLIVDDDTGSIELLRNTLAPLGDLHFATSGEQALRLAHQLAPDIILLDTQMPGLDGFDVCRKLKADPAFSHVPIAFVTRFSDARYETRALDLGAADFITKPYTPAVLQARVRNMLDLKQRIDAEMLTALEQGRRLGVARVADSAPLRPDVANDAQVNAPGPSNLLMMAYIAHEMGNPLQGLLGFAQLMVLDRANAMAPAQAQRLEHIVASGHELQQLMRDVIDFCRFESGAPPIELRAVDLVLGARTASNAVAALAELGGVTLSGPEGSLPLWVEAHPARLQQCLLNLLTNAIKYTPRGGWVRLEVEGDSGDAHRAAIGVRDSGIGMDAVQLQQLFEPFNRLGRHRLPVSGTGLGLAVTRRLVEAMKGRLQVESEAGQGSFFRILLQCPARPEAPEPASLPLPIGSAP